MKLNSLTNKLLVISAAIILFGSGFKAGQWNVNKRSLPTDIAVSNLEEGNVHDLDFSLFWQVWQTLEDKFVDSTKLKPQAMFYGAIKGMVASAGDSYTFFLTPEENKQSKDDLEGLFDGIGAQLGLKNGMVVIVAPLKNSPAQKAGIKPGDIILEVDGKSTEGWNLIMAVSKIRGKKGTPVKLKLLRGEKQIELKIIRDEIKVESVELSFEKKIAILHLSRFGDDTNAEWDRAVSTIVDRNKNGELKGLVLDMRDNPGGFLQGAIYISSEFLPTGSLVVKQQYSNGSSEDYKVDRPGKLLKLPVVVLVNEGSASASEIVAGALKDHKRAKLVGKKSFGKGSIQEALDMQGGAGLHVTIAKWILPGGDWINEKGIKPDVDVALELTNGDTLTRQADKQLDAAINLLIN